MAMEVRDYHYTVLVDCGDHYERIYHSFETENEMFYAAAKLVAFDDLDTGIELESLWVNEMECEYKGWMPGMHICFVDAHTGELVWEDWFPEWDH